MDGWILSTQLPSGGPCWSVEGQLQQLQLFQQLQQLQQGVGSSLQGHLDGFVLSRQVGVQNFSAAVSCSFPASQKRSDYSKLFVVLVVIGSVCTVIITSGFIYICWQRRLPATKTTVRVPSLLRPHFPCEDEDQTTVLHF